MTHPIARQAPIQRHSRVFRALSSLAVAVTLAAVVSQILLAAAPLWKGGPEEPALINAGRELVLSIPALLYVAALYCARRVFLRIAAGDLFSPDNGAGLRSMGRWLLIGALWAICDQGLVPYSADQSLALTMSEVARSSSDLVLAALGLALTLIGRLMISAAAIKAENDEFV
jgi:hypothetical protein